MPSSSTAAPRKKRPTRKKSARGGWISLWPLLVCLGLTPFAIRAASILALAGTKAFSLLYPWVEVVRSPALHLPADLLGVISQWVIYVQFPLYGLLMTLTYRAGRNLRAFIIGLVSHFGGLILAVVLASLGH